MRLELHPHFDADLEDAAEYYEQRDPGIGLGLRFVEAVETAVEWLEQNPEAGGYVLRQKGIRRVVVEDFPYVLHYLISSPNLIRVLGVYHMARDPKRWEERN